VQGFVAVDLERELFVPHRVESLVCWMCAGERTKKNRMENEKTNITYVIGKRNGI
jgi:hypothetical protein